MGFIDEKKTEGRKSRATVPLRRNVDCFDEKLACLGPKNKRVV
jgi:hypothetical protein